MIPFLSKSRRTTAKQKELVHEFIARQVDSRKVKHYDHAISFFVTAWGTIWLSYLFIVRNLLSMANVDIVAQIIDIFGLVVTGAFWALYKFYQFEDRVDGRLIVIGALWLYLETLIVLIIVAVIGFMIFSIGIMLLRESVYIVNQVITLEFFLSGLIWGYISQKRTQRNDELAINLIVRGRQRISVYANNETIYSFNPAVRVASGFIRLTHSIWWSMVLVVVNMPLAWGYASALVLGGFSLASYYSMPVIILILVLLILNVMAFIYRREKLYRKSLELITAATKVKLRKRGV